MMDALRAFLGGGFMPHGHCYLWQTNLVWLHAVSDGLIMLAYYSIPAIILYFIRNRRDIPFPGVFLMFGAFIIACGTTHLLEVVTIWWPFYWLAGSVKAITAIVSLLSAVALVRIMPTALEMPSPAKLQEINRSLQGMNDELERRVADRTRALETANAELRAEVIQRREGEAEIRRLNTQLHERLEEMRVLFDVLPIGVGIAEDADCRVVRSNVAFARMVGLPPGANTSLSAPPGERPTGFYIQKNDRELAAEELPIQTCTREGREIRDFEESIRRRDGIAIDAVVNAVPLFDAAGRVRGCVATFQDVTERNRRAEEQRQFDRQLQETQKLESLGVLAGGIAHDFNNLLTGVLGGASLARTEMPADSPASRYLIHIERSAERAADLCRQMLAYAGRGQFVIETVDLSRLIEEMASLLQLSISKGVTLRLDLARNLPPLRADATQLRQVIMNLVINASEAISPRDGNIYIATERCRVDGTGLKGMRFSEAVTEGDYVACEIRDDGCGMDPATVARMFEPFFSTKFTGRGLGLAAVLGIVRGHKGAIQVDSEPGRGTTFRLLLPASASLFPPTADQPPTGEEWRGSGVVLVVDDEEIVRESARQMLENAGFVVELATDGRDGLERFRRNPHRFAVVLLDLTMPHLDGERTFGEMCQLDSRVRVVLMSGFSEREAVARFVGRGLAAFLQKPFTFDQLRLVMQTVLTTPAPKA